MSTYHPELREVFAHCWTGGTWIAGGICLPANRGLYDHLNQKEPFLKLRNALLSKSKPPLPFLALRRDRVALVVPPEHETLQPSAATSSRHRVVCLLKGAVVTGTLETLASLRVSDFLMRHAGFIALSDCTPHLSARSTLPFPTPSQLVFVNAERVIGVGERS